MRDQPKLYSLTFVKLNPPYNAGVVAGFDLDAALKFVRGKVAVFNEVPEGFNKDGSRVKKEPAAKKTAAKKKAAPKKGAAKKKAKPKKGKA